MNDFWQGITYGAFGGAIVTLSLCIRIIRFLINLHPLPAKATKKQLMSEYGRDCAKYRNKQKRERLTDAEVARIVSVRDHPGRDIVYHLPNSQLRRMIKSLRGEPKDYLKLEELRRELRSEGD